MNWFNKLFGGFILVSAFLFMGAISIHETGTINADGSGTLTVTYTAKTSEVQQNNDLIGNFPFNQKTAKEYFSSANVQVKSSIAYKNKNDTTQSSVTVVMDFKNINNLNELKGFSDNKIAYNSSDDNSKLFRWVISPDVAKNLDQIRCVLTFECKSLNSSNGTVNDKTITFFRENTKNDFTKEIVLGATIETDGNTETKIDASGKPDEKGKSCGLFGLELPLMMLAGVIYSINSKRKNHRK